jgi:protocadherin Fat 4
MNRIPLYASFHGFPGYNPFCFFTQKRSIFTLAGLLLASIAYAQIPGAIRTAAIPASNPMNPNGDAYVTSTGARFAGPLDETEFEIPYLPIAQYQAEPENDNQYPQRLGCDLYEMVDDPANNAESAYYYTRDPDGIANNGDEQVLFRWRLAGWQNGATAFSILIDTDNKFGFSGPTRDPNAVTGNPGFEIEIIVANNDPSKGGAVWVLGVDGVSSPKVVLKSYTLSSRYQVSYALNQDPGCSGTVPVFVDTFIDFSALGIPSSAAVRLVAAVNEDIGSCLGGGASDIGGVDGNLIPNDDNQFIAAINNFPPTTIGLVANLAPVSTDATVSLAENSASGVAVHTVLATDPDDGDALTYSIIGGNTNTAFAINGSSGQITVNNSGALDFETSPSYSLVVRASDGSLFDDAVVVVNLTNVNETPSGADATISLNENSPNGTIVHTVFGTDPDAGAVLNYSITGGNANAAFAINISSGQIKVNNSEALNFETTSSYLLTVRVSDGILFDDAIITVNLANVNETPAAIDGSFSLNENSANGTLVYTVSATDPDAGTSLSYSITGGNTGTAFSINSASGQISVDNSAALNFETTTSFALAVRVSDGSLFDDGLVTVNLVDVNDPPLALDGSASLNENSANGTFVYALFANDPDTDATLTYSITGGNTGSAFAINSATGEITVSNSNALNFETVSFFALAIRVTDGSLFDDAVITVSITNVNQSPSALDGNTSLNENSPNASLVYTMSATDPDAGAVLTYSITAGNTGTAFAINRTSGQITVNNASALNFENTPSFALTVRVSDGSLFDDAIVTINLTNVNEAPYAIDGAISLNENSAIGTIVHTAQAFDPDVGNVLAYSIIAGNTNTTFVISNTSGQITVNNAAALDFETNTSFTLTVRVTDGSLFDDAIITVNIANVNEPPSAADGNVWLNEHLPDNTLIYLMFATDPDSGAELNYSISTGNTGTAFAINNSSGEIIVNNRAAMDFETTPVFTLAVRISDGILFHDAVVTVNLNDLNESPLVPDTVLSLEENKPKGTTVYGLQCKDPDAGAVLKYSITDGNNGAAFSIDDSGVITVNESLQLNYEIAPTFTLTVRVSDGSLFDDGLVTVNLVNVNENPVIADGSVTIDENLANATSVYRVVASDPDTPADLLRFSIIYGNRDRAFSIDNAGQITVNDSSKIDFEAGANFPLLVEVSDGSLVARGIVIVDLIDVNEAPRASDAVINIDGTMINGMIVHHVVASDPDAGDVLSFSFDDSHANSAFWIDPDTGAISILDHSALKFAIDSKLQLAVRVKDRGGLTANAVITIQADKVPIIPLKGFSPDGDGTNDFWLIKGIEAFPDNEVKVFNRWGNLVFETRNYDNNVVAWRGESNGQLIIGNKEVLESTYYFIISVRSLQPITGYVIVKK